MRERSSDATAAAVATIPPVELDTLVPCSPEAAFDYFTRDIARWWERLVERAERARNKYTKGWVGVLQTCFGGYCTSR